MAGELGDLREKLTSVGRLEILDDVGDRALSYFAAVPETEPSAFTSVGSLGLFHGLVIVKPPLR